MTPIKQEERVIKFRAWDKENNYWIYNGYTIAEVAANGYELGGKDLEWVQFTGLHDKNGKEIYEGDIVLRNNKVETANPQWSDRKYIVIWNEEKAQFCLRGEETWGMIWKLEVIGNIYENPELQS